jgi:hypothetical protein
MEPVTATVAAGLVIKYVLPAVRALGERVWDKAEDEATGQAADVAVGFGRRLLQRLVPRRAEGAGQSGEVSLREQDVVARVDALRASPDDAKAAVLAEGAVEALLAADPALLATISDLLGSAPKTAVHQGDRSAFVGGDNSGVIVTGDSNTVQR